MAYSSMVMTGTILKKGAVNSDYTGLAQYNDQWFYIEKGKLKLFAEEVFLMGRKKR